MLPELVIDVASYLHVPQGPGVVLIGHGTDYFMDEGEDRLGLLHSRKRSGPEAVRRLEDLARRTFHVASLLEKAPELDGKLRFSTRELILRVNDRLAAPSTDATFATLKPELDAFARRLFAGPFDLTRVGGPKSLFAARITSAAPTSLDDLLLRAGGPPGPDASIVN